MIMLQQTLFRLSENNNQGMGRILRPSKIKEGVETRKTEGGRVGDKFHGDNQEAASMPGCLFPTVLLSEATCKYPAPKNIHFLYELTNGGGKKHFLVLCPNIDHIQNM